MFFPMKRLYLIFISAFLFLLMNCNRSGKISNQIPHFDLTDLTQTSEVKLSELGVIDIKYIPLETDSSNLISRIKKIETDNNNSFYIADWLKIS